MLTSGCGHMWACQRSLWQYIFYTVSSEWAWTIWVGVVKWACQSCLSPSGSLQRVTHPSVSDTLLYNRPLEKSSSPCPPVIKRRFPCPPIIVMTLTSSTCPVARGCDKGVWPGNNGNGRYRRIPVLVPMERVWSVQDRVVTRGYEHLCCLTIGSQSKRRINGQ